MKFQKCSPVPGGNFPPSLSQQHGDSKILRSTIGSAFFTFYRTYNFYF